MGYFDSETEIRKIKKMLYNLVGVEYVFYDKEEKEMVVSGLIDCIEVETRVREFKKKATITGVDYNVKRLLKRRRVIAVWGIEHSTRFNKHGYTHRYIYIGTSKKEVF